MIRAPMGDIQYWEKSVGLSDRSINMVVEQIKTPSKNPTYRAQYVFDLANDYPRRTITQYSRGDVIRDLSPSKGTGVEFFSATFHYLPDYQSCLFAAGASQYPAMVIAIQHRCLC